ncbi:MAG: FAD-binding oxidoreductase, partial [Parafilimonas terrae]|nr:FAD-binding oxidoreductase [Parafilimonas terrae]
MADERLRETAEDVAAATGRDGILTTDADLLRPATTDYRGWFRGEALALARPRNVAEVQAVVRACTRRGLAIVPQGGNT